MERGRLKQRLSQLFRASLRSSCSITSRNVADAVHEPIYVSRRYEVDEPEALPGLRRSLSLPAAPSSPPGSLLHGRRRRHGEAPPPVDCSCRPSAGARESEKKSKKKQRGVPTIGGGGGFCEVTCPPAAPVSPSPSYYYLRQMEEEMEREEKRLAARKKREATSTREKEKDKEKEKDPYKEKRKCKKLLSNGYGFNSSSSDGSDHDDVGDCFSSDGSAVRGPNKVLRQGRDVKDDTEAVLFSSRSISSDSSEFYRTSRRHASNKKRSSPRRRRNPRRGDGATGRRSRRSSWEDGGFRPLVSFSTSSTRSTAAALGKEGFAVEKESSDPQEDFRSSMVEMIVEKQMFGAAELERLLRCYLELNSPRHHPVIVEVFSEIWLTLFRNH